MVYPVSASAGTFDEVEGARDNLEIAAGIDRSAIAAWPQPSKQLGVIYRPTRVPHTEWCCNVQVMQKNIMSDQVMVVVRVRSVDIWRLTCESGCV